MKCYHPVAAHQRLSGGPLLFGDLFPVGSRRLYVSCGQCVGCRLESARQWAVRCVHEAQLHADNCMLTLTYDETNLPADLSLSHRDFQLFMKRLRDREGGLIRYYMCGEYGETNSRPHYHAVVFGFSPKDKVYFRKSGAGFKCYTSASLDAVWQKGNVYVGDVTFESAGYIARYTLKKVGSDGPRREIIDLDTGRIITRAHEYSRMSLRPGIGARWFSKFCTDVFPHDRIVVRGVSSGVPRYYDSLLQRHAPLYLADVKAKRAEAGEAAYMALEALNWPERFGDIRRLKVHEAVKLASISFLKRS